MEFLNSQLYSCLYGQISRELTFEKLQIVGRWVRQRESVPTLGVVTVGASCAEGLVACASLSGGISQ